MKGNKMTNPGRFIVALAIGASALAFNFNAYAGENDSPFYTPEENKTVKQLYDLGMCIRQRTPAYQQAVGKLVAKAEQDAVARVKAMTPAERDAMIVDIAMQQLPKTPMTEAEAREKAAKLSRDQKIQFLAQYEAEGKAFDLTPAQRDDLVLKILMENGDTEEVARQRMAQASADDRFVFAARSFMDLEKFHTMDDRTLENETVKTLLNIYRVRTREEVAADIAHDYDERKNIFLVTSIVQAALNRADKPVAPGNSCLKEMNIDAVQMRRDINAFESNYGRQALQSELQRWHALSAPQPNNN